MKLIDLHMHTKYSDGTDSVSEILNRVDKKNLNIISITDHNTALAYKEMENMDIDKFYKGNIIPGIELNTKALGVPIEILGYGIDYKKMNELVKNVYIPAEKRNYIEVERLYNKCMKAGMKLNSNCLENFDGTMFASKFIHSQIVKYDENKDIVSEDAWNDTKVFYRKYMSNPAGILYVEMDDFVPEFNVAMNLVRECGGLVFIPHIFEYRDNSRKILEHILENYNIDGIECFYTTFTEQQKQELVELCKERKLFMSGGSDYHGATKPNVDVGTGMGNLVVNDEIISDWIENVKFFNK